MYPCPNPRCKNSWVILAVPILTIDHRRQPILTWAIPCLECIGSIASCCDGGGSAQPEPEGAR